MIMRRRRLVAQLFPSYLIIVQSGNFPRRLLF